MNFSDCFRIKPTAEDDWFNVVLSIDTPLFIDPFLIYTKEYGHFVGSHKEIIDFFNCVFKMIANSSGDRSSVSYKKAQNDLMFAEVEEICLGYTDAGTKGSGSGRGLAESVASAIWEVINEGLTEITHFEEISIIRDKIGADRIGDMTAALLRRRLADYTVQICTRHLIPTKTFNFRRGFFDSAKSLWSPMTTALPENPYNRKAILLIPRKYLKDLPTINPDGFWDYCWSNANEVIRAEFSHDITKNVSKPEILAFARRHPDIRREYIKTEESEIPKPYDFEKDPKGVVGWYGSTQEFCLNNPFAIKIQSTEELYASVGLLVNKFKHFIEQNQGWRLLWNDNQTARGERPAQILCLGIVKHYCQANNIDISRESDIGRGPVDFKVSSGYSARVLIELKLARNTKFWSGIETQLPTYLRAEEIQTGFFIIIIFNDKDAEKVAEIQTVINKVNEETGCRIESIIIDARSESWPPASKA